MPLSNSQIEQLFWKSIISRVWSGVRDEYLKEILEWMGEFISTNIDTHRHILRYIEELALEVLQIFNSGNERARVSAQHSLSQALRSLFPERAS